MQTPKQVLYLVLVAILCGGASFARAGCQAGPGRFAKVSRVTNKVIETATFDLGTGVLRRGPTLRSKAAGSASTAITVNNLDFSGFIGIDSGENGLNGPCEWFSSVQKGTGHTGGQSGYLASFSFAYCTFAQDIRSGGPGGAVTINFWDGFSNGSGSIAGNQGTNVASVAVTGLPGTTGGFGAWLGHGFGPCIAAVIAVDVSGGVPIILPDSNIAISFVFCGVDTFGVLGSTAAFLSCIASCSSTGGLDGSGMLDVVDKYCGGTFLESFSFVTGGPFTTSFTSVSFSLGEVVPLDASDSVVTDNGGALLCNTSTLASVSAPFIGGGAWTQRVDCGSIPGSLTVIFGGLVPIDPLVCAANPFGDFLVNPTIGRLALLTTALIRTGSIATGAIAPSIPLDLSFVGTTVHTQAYCAGFPVPAGQTRLTNRVSTCIGTLE